MEENRRQSDKRMDSLGKDIRELRESFIETHDTVIAINATLNDGMKSAINRSQNFINSYMTGIYQWWKVTNPATGYIAERNEAAIQILLGAMGGYVAAVISFHFTLVILMAQSIINRRTKWTAFF